MLFILTGPIKTGKTRWLQSAVRELEANIITCYGVIAPGRWRLCGDRYEKTGIDNELLPSHKRLDFAIPSDKKLDNSNFNMSWNISTKAIYEVNRHFSMLIKKRNDAISKGILVIDELGILELTRGEGLTEAIELVRLGPSPLTPNAVIVIRESLLNAVGDLFDKWDKIAIVRPNAESLLAIKMACGSVSR